MFGLHRHQGQCWQKLASSLCAICMCFLKLQPLAVYEGGRATVPNGREDAEIHKHSRPEKKTDVWLCKQEDQRAQHPYFQGEEGRVSLLIASQKVLYWATIWSSSGLNDGWLKAGENLCKATPVSMNYCATHLPTFFHPYFSSSLSKKIAT